MNRINQLFSTKQKDILSIYFCAGFPTLEGTASTIKVLEKKGINMIEIGIPFSDPMADGPRYPARRHPRLEKWHDTEAPFRPTERYP